MLNSLYDKKYSFCKIHLFFSSFFDGICTKPTSMTFVLFIISMIVVEGVDSVRFVFSHYFKNIANKSLNAIYYALSYSKLSIEPIWRIVVGKAISIIPDTLKDLPVYICIDDTMVEKFGKKFDNIQKLYDHARHKGNKYMNGHCFVSLMIAVPVWDGLKFTFKGIPIGYKMWLKDGPSKLDIASDMVRSIMPALSKKHNVIILCDSWYAKTTLFDLTRQFDNLDLICNARSDTVLYDLPPLPEGKKKGRPSKHGKRISINDFVLSCEKYDGYHIGTKKVMTNLLKWEEMSAFVTSPGDGSGSRWLFLSTIPATDIQMYCAWYKTAPINQTGSSQMQYLPYFLYSIRWQIEVSYFEQKTFWSLSDYMVRKQRGIEMIVNLISISYAGIALLPYVDSDFEQYKNISMQERRFIIGQRIQKEVFIVGLLNLPQIDINSEAIHAWVANKELNEIAA